MTKMAEREEAFCFMYYTALLGHPVSHSVSPRLFGALAATISIEYGHIKIDVESEDRLAETLRALKMLGFKGANITLPYKLAITRYCNSLDENAQRIGAVNTIAFNADSIQSIE
jgi:shikimate dehydrogenase